MKSKQIITIQNIKSEYFEKAVFVLKDNVVAENDELFKEAVKIASMYAHKFEKNRKNVKMFFLITLPMLLIAGVGALFMFR